MMTVVVCNACGESWVGPGSPAICPKCGITSFGIAVERNAAIDPDNRIETEIEQENISGNSRVE